MNGNKEENIEAIISNTMGYEIYMMATMQIARMIEYPAYDDWGEVRNDIDRAKMIRRLMERKFPALLDEEIQKRCNDIFEKAESFRARREEMEREVLRRKLEFGRVTIEDVKGM